MSDIHSLSPVSVPVWWSTTGKLGFSSSGTPAFFATRLGRGSDDKDDQYGRKKSLCSSPNEYGRRRCAPSNALPVKTDSCPMRIVHMINY